MIVRLKHLEHGWTHAYTQQELDHLLSLGWVIEEEPKKEQPKEEEKPRLLRIKK